MSNAIKITERSIYDHITNFLKRSFNISTIVESKVGSHYPDIVFSIDSEKIILEIKLGDGPKKLIKAISQVYNYARELETRNVIALVLPNLKAGQVISKTNLDKLEEQIISQVVEGYIHTEYWERYISAEEKRSLKDVLEELYFRFIQKKRDIDFNSIIKAIREIVQSLYEVIRQSKTEDIFEEVVNKLELFTSIGDFEYKNKDEVKRQVNMLASYLLFNQLLFYYIYKIKTKDNSIPELKPISSLDELKKCFSRMIEIGYQSIYSINIVDKIPENEETIELINEVIRNLSFIRVEHVTHDLAGRFFHALLPREVAKVWAAFYTHPIAAEILAKLAIDRWDESVIDPACGSGTLLAAAYRRKLELFEDQNKRALNEEELKFLHKKFLEEDLNGIDIMPFASHLAAINLLSQKIEQTVKIVRISTMDSLTLAPKLITKEFKENGILIEPFSQKIQRTFNNGIIILEKQKVVFPSGMGKEFYLKPFDVVLMNPPFSDREKLPTDYKNKLSDKTEFGKILGKICGHQINLWGYFLALADLLLKPNGKIAAVIPINIARGKATEKIRKYILNNYHIRFIIKPSLSDFAFSESSNFKDILLIAEKRKPQPEDITIVVNLKKSIRNLNFSDVEKIIKDIKDPNINSSEFIEKRLIPHKMLIENQDNLMNIIGGFSFENIEIIKNFLELVKSKGKNKIKNLEEKYLKIGLAMPTDNFSKVIFINREIEKNRIKRGYLIFKEIRDGNIVISVKDTGKNYLINQQDVIPAIRTITSIKKINISQLHDFILLKNHRNIEELNIFIESNKKIKEELQNLNNKIFNFLTNICIATRVGLSSPNTSLLCLYSDVPVVPLNAFFIYKNPNYSKDDYKILTLFFNSIIHLAQFMLFKKETTGTYHEIMKNDLKLMITFDINNLTEKEKEDLINLFEKLENIEFPSIIDQLKHRFSKRVDLDKKILEILGFSDNEIDNWLFKIYDTIVKELEENNELS